MSRRTRHLIVVFLALLGLSSYASALATGSIFITGSEQSTSGIWDLGTVTVSINGYTKTVMYGQFSTPDSIASGIAAMFSSDCNGPANAKSSFGGVISVQMRGSTALTQLSVSFSSNLSFNGSANLATTPTTTTASIGSTQVLLGQWTPVDVQVSCNSACGLVDYRIDGGEWGTVALDGNGHFSAGTGTNWSPGLHNVVVKFLGNGSYMPSTSNPVSFTISNSSVATPPVGIYSYGISPYAANGNVSAYSDSVNGSWSNIGYDGLNRLTSATYNALGAPTQYLCWNYDSFGNRKGQTISNSSCDPSSPGPVQYNANNQVQGLGYDASGNVTYDGTNQYLYDAEGRVCAVQGPNGTMQYIYDAEGRRVAKGYISSFSCDNTNNGFTESAGYVLGPNGEQITEVNGQGDWVHTNVFANGELIATYDPSGLQFHLSDWLGTRRVQTDYAGKLGAIYQSLPFGEMIPINQDLGATEHHFTGKERDGESGLDNFGARYYASSTGRWMSPDRLNVTDDRLLNPGNTLNKYAYGANNPLKYTDPDGQDITVFYEKPSGMTSFGHIMFVAENQQTGDAAAMSYGPVHDSEYGLTPLGSPVNSTNSFISPGHTFSADDIRRNFSSLTIQTSPEDAQKIIDFIRNLSTSSNPYMLFKNNCTTTCVQALKILGILPSNNNTITPKGLWKTLSSKYSKTSSKNFFGQQSAPKNGVDYGTRPSGYDPFQLLDLLNKRCTDNWDLESHTLTTNCE